MTNVNTSGMKKTLFCPAIALIVLASCSKEQEAPIDVTPQGETVTIVANVTETKTTHSDRVFSWEADEVISVGTSEGTYVDFDVDDKDAGTFKHTFGGSAPELLMAVTPAQSGATFTSVSNYQVKLPAIYNNYVPGTTNALMIGVPDGVTPNKFNFSHAGALLKITYANVPVGTTAFVLEASENIAGTVSLDGTDVADIEIANDNAGLTSSKVQLNLKNAITAVNSTITFSVPVPTGTYDILEIYLKTADGKISATDKSINKPITLNRGDVLTFPTVTLTAATVLTENFSATKASNNTYNCSSELATTGNDEGLDYSWVPTTGVSNNKVYVFNSGIRLGSGSYAGSITSDDMISAIPTDKICAVYIYCALWNTDTGKIQFTYNGEMQSADPVNDDITSTSDDYSASKFSKPNIFYFTKVAGEDEITLSSSSKRIIIDKIEVVYGLTELLPKAATPGFSADAGSVAYGTSLTLSCDTAGASIYYTLDGTTPDPSNPAQLYSSAISIIDNITVKAIAIKDGYRNSDVASRSFTVPTVANPVITISSNTVTITCATDDATIYYTTDGTDPTTASSVYSSSFAVGSEVTVKAFATKANHKSSGIVSKKNGGTTVSKNSFSSGETSGSIDAKISYNSYKGGAGTAPAIYNSGIRLYQISGTNDYGGYIVITAAAGSSITSVTITSTSTYSTSIKYQVGTGSMSSSETLGKSKSKTVSGISASSVSFYNVGTSSSARLEIGSISVTYE